MQPFLKMSGLRKRQTLHTKLMLAYGITRLMTADWAKTKISPGCFVISDGLPCFTGVTEAGCQHQASVWQLAESTWSCQFSCGTTQSLVTSRQPLRSPPCVDFVKWTPHFLALFTFLFNRCLKLNTLHMPPLEAAL